MLAKALTCAMIGLEGAVVEAEVDISPGLPAFNIVGLPDTAVQEARERVRAAIRNSGFDFPMRRITVNLAPADLKKAGPSYDLSIAVGILSSTGQIASDISGAVFLGELSLDGGIKHTNGILPMVGIAEGEGINQVYVPAVDSKEASLLDGVTVYPANTLGSWRRTFAARGRLRPTPGQRTRGSRESLCGPGAIWPTLEGRSTQREPWRSRPPEATTC